MPSISRRLLLAGSTLAVVARPALAAMPALAAVPEVVEVWKSRACGCCTVIMDGKAIASCMTLTLDCIGSKITTIEGLEDAVTGELNGLQKSFLDNCGYQCGFCTPGIIMTAQALIDENPTPTEEEVRDALSSNYCRCGTHYTAVESVMAYVARNSEVADG